VSTGTEQTIQLPPDSVAGKNLLRAFAVQLGESATLEQVLVLADADGNVVSVLPGGLAVADATSRQLLSDIRDRLDILIDNAERRS